jgi:hypothetical protein
MCTMRHHQQKGNAMRSDDKTEEKQPDFQCPFPIRGTIFWLSAWASYKNGKPRLKISLTARCVECGQEKQAAQFYKNYICKFCHRARRRAAQEHDRASPSVEGKSP